MRIRAYLSDLQPPLEFVSSVRSVVFSGDPVLVIRNRDGIHVLPGGRREPGESIEATLRREVGEETGWTIDAPRLLGFLHFYHLSPKPRDYRYPYPDFLQPIFLSEAAEFDASCLLPDGYELEAGFHRISEVPSLGYPDAFYLEAALRMRGA